MVTKPKERIFLTCKSKNCDLAHIHKQRYTISMFEMNKRSPSLIAQSLTTRKFCTVYPAEVIDDKIDGIPDWKVSPNKPGLRKLIRDAKKENPANLDLLDLIGETDLEIT